MNNFHVDDRFFLFFTFTPLVNTESSQRGFQRVALLHAGAGGGCLNMCLVRSVASLNTSGMLRTDAEVGKASRKKETGCFSLFKLGLGLQNIPATHLSKVPSAV